MDSLTNAQRNYVRRMAHDLRPVVQIGKAGLTEQILLNVDQALDANEMIKVRIVADAAVKDEMIAQMVQATRATLITQIGRVVVLYRQQADPDRRKLPLPA
ncbi:MAG: ribosome assembly RNA-binding protein YhbY [Herpetosiphon sp.]